MTETKSVIFTADDFGASAEVNAGILRAHRQGVLRGTSLMVAAPARDAAVAAAREYPALDVGLHLVVCKGQSVLPPARLNGLVDSGGRFVENPVRGGMRYFFNRGLRAKIADECRAQIELHLKLVGYLNHIDGHLNFHVHPVICDIVIDLAAEYRVPCIRLPREPVFTTLALERDNALRKLVEAVIFRALSRRARRKMIECGIKSTDWLFGLHQSGNLTEHYVLDVIARLPSGLTEIYTHPAARLGGSSRPPEAAEREVEILTSPLLPLALEGAGARLTNFAELARADGQVAAASHDVP
jgi:chitin disaccharide deacetylase